MAVEPCPLCGIVDCVGEAPPPDHIIGQYGFEVIGYQEMYQVPRDVYEERVLTYTRDEDGNIVSPVTERVRIARAGQVIATEDAIRRGILSA